MPDYFSERMASSYAQRGLLSKNACAKRLFGLFEEKKSNLAVAVDVSTCADALKIVKSVAEKVAVVKTHADILTDFTPSFVGELSDLAAGHSFLIFEDRKFADIGSTVRMQYSGGVHKILQWSHLVTVHAVPGPGILEGLYEEARPLMEKGGGRIRAAVVLAQMSSKGNLATGAYTKAAVEMASRFPQFVSGFIGSGSDPVSLKTLAKIAHPQVVLFTPGVSLDCKKDSLMQQYATPQEAVLSGSDCVIVGRGIFKAQNPKEEAEKYRKASWDAYVQRSK